MNQNGLTLIELLAVIAILGILSTIAVISISRVIQDSKDRAFVGNAFALKDAAKLFLKSETINGSVPSNVITYQTLFEAGFLDEFRDPDTGGYPEASDESYVEVTGEKITRICLKGENRNLCIYNGKSSAIPIKEVSVDLILPNK